MGCGAIAGEIKRLFDIGALDDLFVIYPTREESITRMQSSLRADMTFPVMF